MKPYLVLVLTLQSSGGFLGLGNVGTLLGYLWLIRHKGPEKKVENLYEIKNELNYYLEHLPLLAECSDKAQDIK